MLQYREDYTKLGISETATKEEIKSAYFSKAEMETGFLKIYKTVLYLGLFSY